MYSIHFAAGSGVSMADLLMLSNVLGKELEGQHAADRSA